MRKSASAIWGLITGGLLAAQLLPFPAVASCKIANEIPIDLGNIADLHGLHSGAHWIPNDSPGPEEWDDSHEHRLGYTPYVPTLFVSFQNPKEPYLGWDYREKGWNDAGGFQHPFKFSGGKWYFAVSLDSQNEWVWEELKDEVPVVFRRQPAPGPEGDLYRVIGFFRTKAGKLILCPGAPVKPGEKSLDIRIPDAETDRGKDHGQAARARVQKAFAPDCTMVSLVIEAQVPSGKGEEAPSRVKFQFSRSPDGKAPAKLVNTTTVSSLPEKNVPLIPVDLTKAGQFDSRHCDGKPDKEGIPGEGEKKIGPAD